MPTYPSILISNACSYVKPSWTFPDPNRMSSFVLSPLCPNPRCNIMTPNHSYGLPGCLLFPLHCEPESKDRILQHPQYLAQSWYTQKTLACLGLLISRFDLALLPPALYLAYPYIILQDFA